MSTCVQVHMCEVYVYMHVHVWMSEDNLGYWSSGIVPYKVEAKKLYVLLLKAN